MIEREPTIHVASFVENGQVSVFAWQDFEDLLDQAAAPTSVPGGLQRLVYATDIAKANGAPRSVMAVTAGCEHGAIFVRDGRHCWTSVQTGTSYAGPELSYDPAAGSVYPADAVMPLGRVRRVLHAYLKHGRRPAAFLWRRAEDPLPW